jgi:4-hydroxy-tetrahydrodipicolinate synthase
MELEYARSEAKRWARERLVGFFDAPLTPFTREGALDVPGVRHNVDALVDMGMHGLVVGGFIAEAWNLTLSEWMRYHEVIADANAGRLPLSTIILDPSARQAVEKIEFTRRLGYQVAEVMNPAVQLKTDDEIFSFYKYITERTDMAIVLYRTPVSGTVLSQELIQRLADLDTLVGLKQGSLRRSDTYKLRRDIREDFFISEPMEQYFFEDLRMGGWFVQWAAFHYTVFGKLRAVIREYRELAQQEQWDAAWAKWLSLRPASAFIEDLTVWELSRRGTYASAFAILKPWYDAIGLKGGYTLKPVEDVSAERREWLIGELGRHGIA